MIQRPKRVAILTLAGLAAGFVMVVFGLKGFTPGALSDAGERIGAGTTAFSRAGQRASSGTGQETVQNGSDGKPKSVTVNGSTYPVRTYRPLAVNDPAGDQWWTQQTGLDTSWDIPLPEGGTPSVVAVVDSGFALEHEEFAGRWQFNAGEQGVTIEEAEGDHTCTARGLPLDKSCNGLDDDDNGYVDDHRGWDFSADDNEPQAGTTDPTDESADHGTMVTGVLAATGNNETGLAGVDWHAKLLPLQAMGDSELGDSLTVGKAIRYAADQGADVINLSLGTDEEDPYIRLAVRYALDAGAIVVAASGNEGCDCITYPAAYPEVVAVGAYDMEGKAAGFSNHGTALDFLAPGEDITSTSWSEASATSTYASGGSGTSFAAPVVSGLLSRARTLQPDATWAERIAAVAAQADRTGLASHQPRSNTLGAGKVKADAYLARLTTAAEPGSRLLFRPMNATHALATSRVYQCDPEEPAQLPVFQMRQSGTIRYTASILEKERLTETGWTIASEWYACAGLPHDRPQDVRELNLLAEVHYDPTAKDRILADLATPRGQSLYLNPAVHQSGRPAAITSQPVATWLGGWSGNPATAASQVVSAATSDGKLAALVAYNIPLRDCGLYSAGGASSSTAYRTWIDGIAAGIGPRQAMVVLEPDALAGLDCLTSAQQTARLADLAYAVDTLTSKTGAYVYIDAGNASWHTVDTVVSRLQKANVSKARGFALNVSNFHTTAESTTYGNQISSKLNGKSFVIDTSRNGQGANGEWCNPSGRGLGARPTTATTGAVDALLWVKYPGESDGECNGGPAAGVWWGAYADELIRNARY